MLGRIKLATISWLLAILLLVTATVIIISATVVEKNILFIDDSWNLYQTDRSEKARLQTALRSALGYGGLIHDFKNYVLRQDQKYHSQVKFHLGAVEVMLKQYRNLGLTPSEIIALSDIESVMQQYKFAVKQVEKLILNGETDPAVIDSVVKVNDNSAFRGLKLLHDSIIEITSGYARPKPNKSRLTTDLRAAVGYGGMIHHFKSYLLRYDHNNKTDISSDHWKKKIINDIQRAKSIINSYRELEATQAEEIALDDILQTLGNYNNKLQVMEELLKQNKSKKEIDAFVKIDDGKALRGFQILDKEIYHQLERRSNAVSNSLENVKQAIESGMFSSVVAVFLALFMTIWLLRFYVINPVTKLIRSMIQLADNNLDVDIPVYPQENEIGQMAKSVSIFQNNMKQQVIIQEQLESANDIMEERLAEITKYRNLSEEQNIKTLALAEEMVEARKHTEQMMSVIEDRELLVSSILDAVRDAVITISADGIIETFNPGAETMFGYWANQVINKNISMLMPEPLSSSHDGYLKRYEDGQSDRDQSIPFESIAMRKNGQQFPVEVMLNHITVKNQHKITGVVRDVTERNRQREEMQRLAMTDPLTGLANRNQYNKYLKDAVALTTRFKQCFGLMTLDLDKFKPVNDTYGHTAGDILLQHVAKTMLECCREVDTAARLGGDEFAIIAVGLNQPEEIETLANRLIESLAQPVDIEGNTIQIGVSIGISFYPNDSTDIEELTRFADEALYAAKNEGRNTYRCYDKLNK